MCIEPCTFLQVRAASKLPNNVSYCRRSCSLRSAGSLKLCTAGQLAAVKISWDAVQASAYKCAAPPDMDV